MHGGLLHLHQLVQAVLHASMHAGDQLYLRLAEICGDVGVRQRRAKCLGMGRSGQGAIGLRAQTLLLNTAANAVNTFWCERPQGL